MLAQFTQEYYNIAKVEGRERPFYRVQYDFHDILRVAGALFRPNGKRVN